MTDRNAAPRAHADDPLRRLGSLSVARFMREYWQRRPVVLRDLFPGFAPSIDRRRLFDWARDDAVESRLVTSFDGAWSVDRGPFVRMPARSRGPWSLLIQGADRLDDEARSVLSRFRFVPDARLDDVMISYATIGGGVGPHVDSYDVFLLQAQGRRRWRVGTQGGHRLIANSVLRHVRPFKSDAEWTLDPGDALYLPPGVAHDGIAVDGECMTWSIGFRAPQTAELLEPWIADFVEHGQLRGRYGDRGSKATRHPAQLPAAMIASMHRDLMRARPQRVDTERFLLRRCSEPAATVFFDAPAKAMPIARFTRSAARLGIELDRRTRMLYSQLGVAINGEFMAWKGVDRDATEQLADARRLEGATVVACRRAMLQHLYVWYCAGWLGLRTDAKLGA